MEKDLLNKLKPLFVYTKNIGKCIITAEMDLRNVSSIYKYISKTNDEGNNVPVMPMIGMFKNTVEEGKGWGTYSVCSHATLNSSASHAFADSSACLDSYSLHTTLPARSLHSRRMMTPGAWATFLGHTAPRSLECIAVDA